MLTRLIICTFLLLGWAALPDKAEAAGASCGNAALYDASTNGTTLLVTGGSAASGLKVYICGFDFFSAGTVNVKLTYGTGSSCTGATAITPAFQFTAQTGLVDSSPTHRGLLAAPAGNNVCLVTSAGTAVQAIVYYTVAP